MLSYKKGLQALKKKAKSPPTSMEIFAKREAEEEVREEEEEG